MCASDKLRKYLQDTQWSFAETIVKLPVSTDILQQFGTAFDLQISRFHLKHLWTFKFTGKLAKLS